MASEDRFSRLNAYEYGSNPAGLLGLRDTSWRREIQYQSFDDGYYAEDHSAIMRKSGIRGAVQQERWALGLDVVYGAVNASRHDEFGTPDNSRFIRDFDLPFAGSFNPIVGDRTIGARVVYPGAAITCAGRSRGSRSAGASASGRRPRTGASPIPTTWTWSRARPNTRRAP